MTALNQKEPQNLHIRAIIGDDPWRPLAAVSPQRGVINANSCTFMQMSCDVVCHVTALDQSDPSIQLTCSAPWR